MKLNKSVIQGVKSYPSRVIQFGEGNFLRGFADWIIDEMNEKIDFNSGITIVQPRDKGMIDILNAQEGLYNLYLNGIQDKKVVSNRKLITSVNKGLNLYESYEEFLKLAEDENMRFIISNTTEAGIAINDEDKLEDRPQSTYPGKLTSLLYKRYKTFKGDTKKGFILLPCELIEKNGEKLKEAVLHFAKLWNLEDDFILWIESANTFCNTLVDRIVPGYPASRIDEITDELGYEDKLVVDGEIFHLWVIEGPGFVKEEFPADKAGLNVVFTEDLTPYRTIKVRILNGAHTTMVPVSYLYGIDTVRDSVLDEVIGNYIKQAIFEEIAPTLDLDSKEVEKYAEAVLERFENPYIRHELMSISLNSWSKFDTRVVPSITRYYKDKNSLPKKLIFSLASLIMFYRGKREEESIKLSDDQIILEKIENLWSDCNGSEESLKELAGKILRDRDILKTDLSGLDGLESLLGRYLVDIYRNGISKAIKEV